MHDASDSLIDVTNEVGMSGKFLQLWRAGQLSSFSDLIHKRVIVARKLAAVERKLRACNHPVELSRLERWCRRRNQSFEAQLCKIVAKAEDKKRKLIAELNDIDEQLDRAELEWEWDIGPGTMNSLVPKIVENPLIAERNEVIDVNLHVSNRDICALLDRNFARDGAICDELPKSWVSRFGVNTFLQAYMHPECRNKVHKMISIRRALLRGLPQS